MGLSGNHLQEYLHKRQFAIIVTNDRCRFLLSPCIYRILFSCMFMNVCNTFVITNTTSYTYKRSLFYKRHLQLHFVHKVVLYATADPLGMLPKRAFRAMLSTIFTEKTSKRTESLKWKKNPQKNGKKFPEKFWTRIYICTVCV